MCSSPMVMTIWHLYSSSVRTCQNDGSTHEQKPGTVGEKSAKQSPKMIELPISLKFGFGIVSRYWSRRHIYAVCFSGFSA